MGCLVVLNYYLVMTFFPGVVVFRELYLKSCVHRCTWNYKSKKDADAKAQPEEEKNDNNLPDRFHVDALRVWFVAVLFSSSVLALKSHKKQKTKTQDSKVSACFKRYHDYLHRYRWILILVCLGLFLYLGILTKDLQYAIFLFLNDKNQLLVW